MGTYTPSFELLARILKAMTTDVAPPAHPLPYRLTDNGSPCARSATDSISFDRAHHILVAGLNFPFRLGSVDDSG